MGLRQRTYLVEGLQVKDAGASPLHYNRSSNVRRLVLCDTSVKDSPSRGDTYIADEVRMRYRTKGGRKLKKPVVDERIPGVGDNCIVGFLDWSKWGDEYYRLDYIKTRYGFEGKGYARKLIESFYKKHGKAGVTIHWGKMMQPAIGHLFKSIDKKFSKVTSSGSEWY